MYGCIGYAYNGSIYCEDCLGTDHSIPTDEITPVTDEEEVDSPIHCDECGTFLGGCLLNRGVLDLEERMLNARISLDTAQDYIAYWDWTDWAVFETFYGAFDILGRFH